MRREDLEHIIRAAADIADDDEIVVIGSQSILGTYPNAPPDLLVSMEADVYPKNHPERADVIDGAIGELSLFHDTFGYYAQGVGATTATLPDGWKDRVVIVRGPGTRQAAGLCLEPHDLAISKFVAGREKDLAFVRGLLSHVLVDPLVLRERLARTHVDDVARRAIEARIDAMSRQGAT